jgi:hypothetical protein
MRPDCSHPPVPTARQLALPREVARRPPVGTGLGPLIPPRRVWRGLSPAARAGVRRAVLRVCQEVVHDNAAGC